MPNNYVAPYLISTEPPANVPVAGTFTVPVCTTSERFDKIMNALFAYGAMQGDQFDFDHLIDWLDAMPRITEGCEPRNPVCRTLPLSSESVTWFPESPYAPGEELPEGYDFHPWTIANSSTLVDIIIAWGLGYKNGDVFTDLSKFPDITDPENFTENYLNLPRFRLTVEGTGTVKVDILSIPFGGRLVVLIDEFVDLLNISAADTDRDASFPPESIVSMTIETEITTAGTHTIDYVFYPTFETELPFIGGGGGVRSIELCGFGVTDMAGENCCDETNALLTTNNAYLGQIVAMLKDGWKLVPINQGLPSDSLAFSECAPDKFDSDIDDTGDEPALRLAALCYVIHCYIVEILYKACIGMGIPSVLLDAIFPDHATMPPALHRINVEYPPLLSLTALIENIAFNGEFTDLVTCAMLVALRGKMNTFGSFRDSVATFGGFGSIAVPISGMVSYHNQRRENYNIFNEALDQAMSMETEVEAYTCPCAADCTDPLQLIIVDGRGTIELVDTYTDLYHLTGDNSTFDGVNYHGGVYVRDALGRTLSVWNSDVVELPTQPVLYHHIIGRCGTSDSTGLLGGWAGLTEDTVFVERFYQDQQTGPTDTYYRIKCIDECP